MADAETIKLNTFLTCMLEELKEKAKESFEAYEFNKSLINDNKNNKREKNTREYASEELGKFKAMRQIIRKIEKQIDA